MDWLDRLGVAEFSERNIDTLSGGQRQRVALARALVIEPPVLLLDEPLSNLDAKLREEMQVELRLLQQRLGITTIVVTHDQREAMALADVMAVMARGQFLQMGAPTEIYDRPASAEVARFIGRGAVVDGHLSNGHVQLGPFQARMEMAHGQSEGPVTAFLRPRNIAHDPDGVGATVDAVLYRGGVWEVRVRVPNLNAPLVVDLDQRARPGDILPLRVTGGWIVPD